jgi:hypothetical protein
MAVVNFMPLFQEDGGGGETSAFFICLGSG